MALFSTNTGVAVIDTRSRQGTITLPLTTQIPNRYLQFKDLYGAFGRSSLTLSTQTGETFDDGTTSKVYTDPFTFLQLYAASTTRWAQLGGTQTIQQTVSSLNVSSITIGTGAGWLQLPPIQNVAVSTNTINADTIITNSTTSMYISAQILYVSSIMGAVVGGGSGDVTTGNLTSTVGGLGQIYISTAGGGLSVANLTSTVGGLGQIYISTAGGGLSAANLASTVQGLGTYGYLSSVSGATGFVSSLTVNTLTLGTGAGWLQLPPLQTIYASTTYLQGQALYSISSYFGNTSTVTALQYNGLFGNYNNTVLAELSTGAGSQEFLVFKGSSTSDRVRVQTTGNFVVETGVSSRLWSNGVTTQPNATPAFVIDITSNVGIQTAFPGATLDVAGSGRFQGLSTMALNISSINGSVYTPGGGGGGGGAIDYVSAFTVSTSYLEVSTVSSHAIFAYGVIASQFLNPGPDLMGITTIPSGTLQSFGDWNFTSGYSTIINANAFYLSSSNDARIVAPSNVYLDSPEVFATGGISTYSMTIYGPSTLTVQGWSFFQNVLSTPVVITNAVGILDAVSGEPVYIQASNGTVAINGGTLLDQTILTSTIEGLGTLGYISTPGGGIASIPNSLSTFEIFTSSLYASSMQILNITTQALSVSSFFTATRQMTPMFVTF